jgi:MFS family permease
MVGVTLTQFTFVGVLICIFPHLVSIGVSWEAATAMSSAIALMGFGFKLIAGRLADSVSVMRLLAICNAVQAVTMVLFASLGPAGTTTGGGSPNIALCWVACLIYGAAMGGVGPLISIIQIDVFGLRSFAILGGYVQMSAQVVPGIVGPLASGAIFDATGSYNGWFSAMVVVYLVAGGTVLCTRKYRDSDEEAGEVEPTAPSTSVAV